MWQDDEKDKRRRDHEPPAKKIKRSSRDHGRTGRGASSEKANAVDKSGRWRYWRSRSRRRRRGMV